VPGVELETRKISSAVYQFFYPNGMFTKKQLLNMGSRRHTLSLVEPSWCRAVEVGRRDGRKWIGSPWMKYFTYFIHEEIG